MRPGWRLRRSCPRNMSRRAPTGAPVHIRASLCLMFHLQLRQFPHNHSQFNLTEQELHAIAGPWVRGQWLAIGERKWNAHQAKLTIVEGPRVQMAQLSMG